jgi:transposase InsO family protein
MPPALTPEQHLQIVDRYRRGHTLSAIAQDLGIHYETARKWARIYRRQGRQAVAHRPRKPTGRLREVPQRVVQRLLQLRQEHPNWGKPYLRQQLLHHPDLSDQERAAVPSLSTFYRFLREHEERPAKPALKNHVPASKLVQQAQYPHHLWQMDLKEKCRLRGLDQQITVANVRDVFSSLTVGAVVFQLTRRHATLSGAHMQQACRECFAEWGLPDVLRTDQGTCFTGNFAQTRFPSAFTLWLVGLGVKHETIPKGKVTQNGCVERFNRTYNNLVLRDGPFANLEQVRQVSRRTVHFLNQDYPSQAGRCHGQPPLTAHPSARLKRRPYQQEQEAQLFSLQRVDQYLTQFRWQRRADQVGKVSLADQDYYLGRAQQGRVFDVVFDAAERTFVFTTPDGQVEVRHPALGLKVEDLTDISGHPRRPLHSSDKAHPLRAYGK